MKTLAALLAALLVPLLALAPAARAEGPRPAAAARPFRLVLALDGTASLGGPSEAAPGRSTRDVLYGLVAPIVNAARARDGELYVLVVCGETTLAYHGPTRRSAMREVNANVEAAKRDCVRPHMAGGTRLDKAFAAVADLAALEPAAEFHVVVLSDMVSESSSRLMIEEGLASLRLLRARPPALLAVAGAADAYRLRWLKAAVAALPKTRVVVGGQRDLAATLGAITAHLRGR